MKIVSIVLAAASCWIRSATANTCEHDSYPFGEYSSFLAPCQVDFYQSKSSADWGYGCDSMDASALQLETRPINIFFFPDQCVGDEARCYTLKNKMMSLNESLHEDLLPPEGTTHVMVNCMEDNAAAGELMGNLTDAMDQMADSAVNFLDAMVILGWVFIIGVVASIGACIYCCVSGCRKRGPRRVEHVMVEMPAMGEIT
eukprot:scaffold266121_cov49-Attheya_sp.AAC.2